MLENNSSFLLQQSTNGGRDNRWWLLSMEVDNRTNQNRKILKKRHLEKNLSKIKQVAKRDILQ